MVKKDLYELSPILCRISGFDEVKLLVPQQNLWEGEILEYWSVGI